MAVKRSRSSKAARLEVGPCLAGTPLLASPDERQRMISDAAYFRAERRGFVPGHELEDWLGAERDVDGVLAMPIAAREAA